MRRINANTILWLIYLSLLAVLLPHTAWAFSGFEPDNRLGAVGAWAAALTFEAGIAAYTHKLAQRIGRTPRYTAGRVRWRTFTFRYLNAYAAVLLLLTGVSVLANVAHAIEFGGELAIFTEWGVPFAVYAVAFGGILPIASLLFARVLSNVAESEGEQNEELVAAKATIRKLRRDLRAAEERAAAAEEQFGVAGGLFAEQKRQRIEAAAERWPSLPPSSVAIVAEASPSYVSEVLSENGR